MTKEIPAEKQEDLTPGEEGFFRDWASVLEAAGASPRFPVVMVYRRPSGVIVSCEVNELVEDDPESL